MYAIENTRRRVLTPEEVLGCTPEELAEHRLLGHFLPILGGEPEGEGEGGEGGSSGSGGEGGEGGSGSGASGGGPEGSAGSGGSGEGGEGGEGGTGAEGDGEYEKLPRSEVQRLKRIAAEADKSKKDAEKAQKAAREREQREQGRWEEMIKEKDEEVSKANQRAEKAEGELADFKNEILVSKVAQRLRFKDPSDAALYLRKEQLSDEEMQSEKAIESALKRIVREKQWLVEKPTSTGAPVGGGNNGKGTTLTRAEVEKMSPDEINARWDEVQQVMTADGS